MTEAWKCNRGLYWFQTRIGYLTLGNLCINHCACNLAPLFIRPSSDGTYYGMVMSVRPGLRPSDSPSVRPGLRPPVFHTFLKHALTYWAEILFYCTTDQVWVSSISVKYRASYAPFVTYNTWNTQFSALFSNMLWHIELKLCIWLCFIILQIKFECCQFASIFVGVMPLLELTILETHSFPHFSLTCFDILSWNFAHDFVILYYRSSLSVVNLRHFCGSYVPFGTYNTGNTQFSSLFSNMLWHIELKFCIWLCFTVLQIEFECRQFRQVLCELCPFCNFQYWKYTVIRTFLLHALIYSAEILHMTLLYCTTDQVWVLSICINFCRSYAPFGTLNTWNTQSSTLFSYMLWHIELKFCTWLCFTEIQTKLKCRHFASIFVGVMPLLELTILGIHSFPHFSITYFDIFSWNFAHDFVILYYRSSSSVVNLRQFLWELCPFPFGTYNTGNTQLSALFYYILWYIQLKFCTWLCYTVLQIKFECCQFASIFVGVMSLLELTILGIHSFPHFSLTCFDILSWNFAYDFVLLYYRSSSSVVNFVKFCASYAPFVTYNTGNTQLSALFYYMLWYIQLKFCTWLCYTVLQIKFECCQFASIFVGVMLFLELWILEIHSLLHFSLTCFDILSWNFAHDFVLLKYRQS